jgi:DNA invertase Pin-like site-specific DNA recombinase
MVITDTAWDAGSSIPTTTADRDTSLMRRGYSYKRFSSPKQSRGDSMRRQTEFEQTVLREMDLFLDDTCNLSDTGISAFKGQNRLKGALGRFIKLIEQGRIPVGSVLIIENVDRLSRAPVNVAFPLFMSILEAGVEIVTGMPSRKHYTKDNTRTLGDLIEPLYCMQLAYDESLKKSERLRHAWASKRKLAGEKGKPMTGSCPRWLKVVGQRDGYEVIEERAEVVRQMFRWVGEGVGVIRIVKRLHEEGYPTFGSKDGWNKSYVRKILANRAVYGEAQFYEGDNTVRKVSGSPVPNHFPAIVAKEEFDLAQATIKERAHCQGRPAVADCNLFTGLVYHAGDRVKMSLSTTSSRRTSSSRKGQTRRVTYLLSGLVRNGRGSGGRRFPYTIFEEGVLETLTELKPSDVSGTFYVEKTQTDAELKRLTEDIFMGEETLKRMGKEIVTLATSGASEGTITRKEAIADQIENDLAKKRERKAEIEAEALNCRVETLDEAKTIIGMMKRTPPGIERDKLRGEIKTKLRWMVSSIWVHIEKINHLKQFAHVQVFLRNGGRRDLVLSSFKPTPQVVILPADEYTTVDFRKHNPMQPELAAG